MGKDRNPWDVCLFLVPLCNHLYFVSSAVLRRFVYLICRCTAYEHIYMCIYICTHMHRYVYDYLFCRVLPVDLQLFICAVALIALACHSKAAGLFSSKKKTN